MSLSFNLYTFSYYFSLFSVLSHWTLCFYQRRDSDLILDISFLNIFILYSLSPADFRGPLRDEGFAIIDTLDRWIGGHSMLSRYLGRRYLPIISLIPLLFLRPLREEIEGSVLRPDTPRPARINCIRITFLFVHLSSSFIITSLFMSTAGWGLHPLHTMGDLL